MSKWIKGFGAALIVLALASACSDDSTSDNSNRDDSGNITEGGDVGVFALQVGDCFDQPPDGDVIEVAGVPCDQPHDNEIFAIFDMEGGGDAAYPGDAAVQAASEDCIGDLFTEYVGVAAVDSRFGATSLNPTQESWEGADDREIICIATTSDGTKITGTIKDTEE